MNKTIIFSDLEGTILRESDRSYSDEDMFNFLQGLNTLTETTDSICELHLVSPVSGTSMNNFIDKIDKNIRSFNTITNSHIPYIYRGYCTNNCDINVRLPSNIITTKPPTPNNFQSWKSIYVHDICNRATEQHPNDVLSFIYFGNGRNDIRAMETVQQFKGLAICPQNSRTAVKATANFVGNSTDLRGITDGLNQYIKTLQPPEQNVNESIETEK